MADKISFSCAVPVINRAFAIALQDVRDVTRPFKGGLLEEPRPVFISGGWYRHPWTRDNSYNTWSSGGLLFPEVARNSLLSVVQREAGGLRITGQYWDCIAWATGAWMYWLYTGDRDFLDLAYPAVTNTLGRLEESEWNSRTGLFRGQPSYADGVSAFPSPPYRIAGHSDGAVTHATVMRRDEKRVHMQALSTNCLYVNAYAVAAAMAALTGQPSRTSALFRRKAVALKKAINRRLWLKKEGHYAYYLDRDGLDATQESLGHAFAILFGVAGPKQIKALFANQHVTRHGVPCLWPVYPEYATPDHMTYGRHSGTVWPMQMGFWAMAAARERRLDLFAAEWFSLADLAVRAGNFAEMFHPLTGEPYGGLQEISEKRLYNPLTGEPYGEFQIIRGRRFYLTASKPQTTWGATGFMGMAIHGLLGLRFSNSGIAFEPLVPEGLGPVKLEGLQYRGRRLCIEVTGRGKRIKRFVVNGKAARTPFIPVNNNKDLCVSIDVRE